MRTRTIAALSAGCVGVLAVVAILVAASAGSGDRSDKGADQSAQGSPQGAEPSAHVQDPAKSSFSTRQLERILEKAGMAEFKHEIPPMMSLAPDGAARRLVVGFRQGDIDLCGEGDLAGAIEMITGYEARVVAAVRTVIASGGDYERPDPPPGESCPRP